MPALFAYLVAVGLLLGGGYGALSWLAAPEPVKVAGKTKPKPPPHYETSSQAAPVVSSLDANSPSLGSSNEAKPASAAPDSSAQLTLRQSGLRTTAMEQATQAPVLSQPARDQQNRSANSGAPSAKAKQHAEASPPEARPEIRRLAPPSNQPTVASVAPAARAVKPRFHRQAGSHSEKPAEKRALALMTLRTIEFADGHRVSRLIPYRSPERALAFEPNE